MICAISFSTFPYYSSFKSNVTNRLYIFFLYLLQVIFSVYIFCIILYLNCFSSKLCSIQFISFNVHNVLTRNQHISLANTIVFLILCGRFSVIVQDHLSHFTCKSLFHKIFLINTARHKPMFLCTRSS